MLGERWPAHASWLPLAALGVLTVVAPFVLFNRAAPTLPAGYSAVLNATAPVFGVTWGSLFLGEPVTARMLPGSLLILLATALITGFNPWRLAARRR